MRKAVVEDAEKIIGIIKELNVFRDSKEEMGFVEYPVLSMEELKRRIEKSEFFYVAENKGEIVGFLSAYSDENLKELDFKNDEIVKHILKKEKSFVYWDQIGIVKDYQRKRLGVKLSSKLLNEILKKGYDIVWCTPCHFPKRNKASILLIESFEFKLIEEIKVYDGLIFGVYRKGLDW